MRGDGRVHPARGRGGRHGRLRRATASAHLGVEAALQGAGCFAAGADGYRRYLAAVAPLHAALEATLEAAGAARLVPDWPARRKAGLVLAELRSLGGPAHGPAQDRLSPGAAATTAAAIGREPPLWCAGDVLGALYVLEGATLGGAVLARRMRDLGALPDGGACLLDPYGTRRGAMWRAFLERLEAAELTRAEEGALCPRAVATFALFAAAAAVAANGARGGTPG